LLKTTKTVCGDGSIQARYLGKDYTSNTISTFLILFTMLFPVVL